MTWILVVLLVNACTWVGLNGKLKSESKTGFFVVLGVLALVVGLFSLLFG